MRSQATSATPGSSKGTSDMVAHYTEVIISLTHTPHDQELMARCLPREGDSRGCKKERRSVAIINYLETTPRIIKAQQKRSLSVPATTRNLNRSEKYALFCVALKSSRIQNVSPPPQDCLSPRNIRHSHREQHTQLKRVQRAMIRYLLSSAHQLVSDKTKVNREARRLSL